MNFSFFNLLQAGVESFSNFLEYPIWGNNNVLDIITVVAVFLGVFIVLKLFKSFGTAKLKKISQKTKTQIDDVIIDGIDSIGWFFYFYISLYFSLQILSSVPAIIDKILYYILIVVLTWYVVLFVQRIIAFSLQNYSRKKQEEDKDFEPHTVEIIRKISNIAIWIVAIILILQNLGYNISALVAGLGVGGVAIAFALQNILTDIFASFSIYFDKPFKIGDFIIVGSDMGTVQKIGIKSTRIKSLQGQELVISNKELTETRVNNYGKMSERRIVFNLGVAYETPVEKLKKIDNIVKEAVENQNLTRLDRVHFKQFGDFSLNYEVVYFVEVADYNKYMDTQESINLALKEAFEKEGITFAYPTQTIYLAKD